jgi:alpha-galactosidase
MTTIFKNAGLKPGIVLLLICMLAPLHKTSAQTAEKAGTKEQIISVKTSGTSLVLKVAKDGHLYQQSYGRAKPVTSGRTPAREDECYPPAGNGFISEPAFQAVHADGNISTDLVFISADTTAVDANITHTRIRLRDTFYPLFVTVNFKAYRAEDVIEQWVEVRHEENKPVTLSRFASSAMVMKANSYWLSQFHGNYMREAALAEEQLTPGIKVLDSKIGVRAHQMRNPSFIISLDQAAREETGETYGATLAWSGNFQFAFEVDHNNRLRALCGINPFAAEYRLEKGKVFTTPAVLWSWSNQGKGQISRNFHRWARKYGIRDGEKPRPVLLNNWEATHMDFDEQKIVSLFDGAKELGVDLFLLDDGWFGNKHPRDNDAAGLGDWEVNKKKLPQGLPYLAAEANKRGVNFGIWLEPEMVNPASELYEKHPDWVITQPHRELLYGRNQLVLDLTRPEVKEFAWLVVNNTLSNKGVAYVKWDCNRYVTQPGSFYLKPDQQQHLLIDYQWALYDVMKRMADKHPDVMAMLCAGGSGRVDYGALKYFHSFWPSDNTDPLQRIYIQWGFSHFFPANTISAHVTDMGKRPVKFATDVALSGAFGVDRDVQKMTEEERKTAARATALYKERLRDIVLQGDLYRLESPYEKTRASLNYVSADRSRAVLFIYQLGESAMGPIKPRGLDPAKKYRIKEINLPEGKNSRLSLNDQVVSGAVIMEEGLSSPLRRAVESAVVEFVEEK